MKTSILALLLAVFLVAFATNVNTKSIQSNPIEVSIDSKSNEDSNAVNESTEAFSSEAPQSSSETPENSSSAAPQSSSEAPENSSSAAPQSSSEAPEESSSAAPQSSSEAPENSSSAATQSSSEAPEESSSAAPQSSSETPEESSSAAPQPSSEAPEESSSAAQFSPNVTEENTTGAPESSSNAPEETTESESSSSALTTTTGATESFTNAPEETTTEASESSTGAPEDTTTDVPQSSSNASEETSTEPASEAPVETTQAPDQKADDVKPEDLEKFVEDMFNKLGKFVSTMIDSVSKGQTVIEIPKTIIIKQAPEDKLPIQHSPSVRPLQPIAPFIQKPVPIEGVEIEARTFKTLWWILKSILKTLRGINCTIKGVVNVKESTEQMFSNFQVCGVETSKQIQAVLDSAQKVISISNDIVNINDNVCNNPDYLADVDASQKASSKCVKQLRSKILNLNSQIKTTTKLIKKVPTNAGDCVTTTFSTYQQSIIGFPDFVKTCAKF